MPPLPLWLQFKKEVTKISVSWSGGKDCMMALHKILSSPQFEVHSLHTTVDTRTKRVGMHGVPLKLIEQQARSLRLPLHVIDIQSSDHHGEYERSIKSYYQSLDEIGIDEVAFGDIFLEDLKIYRESLFAGYNLKPVFPLWGSDTQVLINEFLNAGFKAVVCAADGDLFDESCVGRLINQDWIASLPKGVDSCGERGEFHSFVYDGPGFTDPVAFQPGAKVTKQYDYLIKNNHGKNERHSKRFWFQDLVPSRD